MIKEKEKRNCHSWVLGEKNKIKNKVRLEGISGISIDLNNKRKFKKKSNELEHVGD